MAFNIHITRIGEHPTSGELTAHSAKVNKNRTATAKRPENTLSLINVPAGHVMTKYPVRIFELQTQE